MTPVSPRTRGSHMLKGFEEFLRRCADGTAVQPATTGGGTAGA